MSNYYQMNFDMEMFDNSVSEGNPFIYADSSNIDSIEVEGVKKGFFNGVILNNSIDFPWPDIEFYFSSQEAHRECDFLGNIARWPIIHKNVRYVITQNNIQGVSFYPVNLIDSCTNKKNENYYLLFISNFIDAFDMEKSQYKYNQKYNFYTFIPKKTFLDINNCYGYDIFRAEKSPSMIFVSEKLKKIIEDCKFSGFRFSIQK